MKRASHHASDWAEIGDLGRAEALIARYGDRVPRYTSYPTAPHFNTDIDAVSYAGWLAALDPEEAVSAYMHIPFCRSLCWYCACNMSVARSRAPVADYVQNLVAEIRMVRSHVGRELPIGSLHFGGGTPNALSPQDLDRLCSELRRWFRIEPTAEIAAEIDPRILTREWVEAAAAVGVDRVSLGVQDIEPRVQEAVNRIQPFAQTASAVDAFRRAGIVSINVDLMYGLPHQTEASVARTVTELLELSPDRVALFGYAHVPWMKPAQRQLPEEALPNPLQRFRQQDVAAKLLVSAGYVRIGLDHFAKPGDRLAREAVSRNFQGYTTDRAQTLLGLGASAIGRLPQGYVQNMTRTPDWRRSIVEHRLPTARGVVVNADDAFRGELISRLMCDLSVDVEEVGDRFGFTVAAVEQDLQRLGAMEDDGLVERDGSRIHVTETGRPFVRSICAVFDRYLDRSAVRHAAGV